MPLRVHLESYQRQTGKRPPELDTPPIPASHDRPFRLWLDLHQGRMISGMGLTPLSWVDFDAYARVMGERFSRADVRLIRLIEDEFHASRSEAEEAKERRAKTRAAARG